MLVPSPVIGTWWSQPDTAPAGRWGRPTTGLGNALDWALIGPRVGDAPGDWKGKSLSPCVKKETVCFQELSLVFASLVSATGSNVKTHSRKVYLCAGRLTRTFLALIHKTVLKYSAGPSVHNTPGLCVRFIQSLVPWSPIDWYQA